MPEKTKSSNVIKPKSSVSAGSSSAATSPQSEAEQPETQEVVFTVKTATGEVVKIEKLDKGGRQELTDEEYAQMAAVFSAALGGAEAYYDPYATWYADMFNTEAYYYQGMVDYAAALELAAAQDYGYSPEELAYYQGMADYAAALC